MKKLLLIILICFFPANPSQESKPPFSVNALQYLLDRKEYDRFDWYIERYLNHYPDTAILHLLKGHRYYDEATHTSSKELKCIINRTGGIPRKYSEHLTQLKPFSINKLLLFYNKEILDKAFASMRHARAIEPGRKDIFMKICRMAAETGRSDILAREATIYISQFGYTKEIEKLTLDYLDQKWGMAADSNMVFLVRNLTTHYSNESELYMLIGNYYFLSGDIDSAYYYTLQALDKDDQNLYNYQKAIILASIKCNFPEATQLALRRYELSKKLIDLEQAAICAYAYDRFKGMFLYTKVLKSESASDSATISKWLFDEFIPSHDSLNYTNFFNGDLFHLNFPLFYITYRKDLNQVNYYNNKAGAYFISGVYDSASYYNLKLLTTMTKEHPLVQSALYNLAAEFYATGKYVISFQMFLWMYKYLSGGRDFAIRYALAVNYEQFGDLYHAKEHYTHIMNHAGKIKTENKNLRELARLRLNNIRGKKIYTQ